MHILLKEVWNKMPYCRCF